jgi:hypothetical protein
VTLQLRVSEALQASPRGREPSLPGERFRRSVLSAMPDIEAMELVERFFELGERVVGTDHPVGIFLAGCPSAWPTGRRTLARNHGGTPPIARRTTAQGATAALPTWANRVGNSADDPA